MALLVQVAVAAAVLPRTPGLQLYLAIVINGLCLYVQRTFICSSSYARPRVVIGSAT
jgi:hypothetical protein